MFGEMLLYRFKLALDSRLIKTRITIYNIVIVLYVHLIMHLLIVPPCVCEGPGWRVEV